MINEMIVEFHKHRLNDNHEQAMNIIEQLKIRYSFSKNDLLTAMVTEGFLEDACVQYLEDHKKK